MLPGDVDVVAHRVVLDELHVGDQRGARQRALDEVVAEHGVLGEAVGHGRVEGRHVVDALAGEGPLVEQVLVDVGDGENVRVDPAPGGEHRLEHRGVGPGGERRRHPRLHQGVALGHEAGRRVGDRAVDRVHHLAHQRGDGAPRQAGVAVEGDDEPDVVGMLGGGAEEGRLAASQQQGVELGQLAALALPPHPDALDRVPDPRAVQQVEAAADMGVALAQAVHLAAGVLQDPVVELAALHRGIGPVGDQREVHRVVGVGEVVQLEQAHEVVDGVLVGDEARHGDEGARRLRDPVGVVEGRQAARRHEAHRHQVHEAHGRLRGRQERQREEEEPEGQRQRVPDEAHGHQRDGHGDEPRRPEDPRPAHPPPAPQEPLAPVRIVTAGGLQRLPLPAHEEVADRLRVGEAHGRPRHLDLAHLRAPRDLLDPVAVVVAGRPVEPRELGGFAQDRVDLADLLDPFHPVRLVETAHALDHVADRDVGGGLPAQREVEQPRAVGALPLQRGLEHGERGIRLVRAVAQAVEELGREDVRQLPLADLGQRLALAAHQPVGQRVGGGPVAVGGGDLVRDAPQVLEHHVAQHRRDGPELADLEGLHRLVALDHLGQALDVELGVRQRHVAPGEGQRRGHPVAGRRRDVRQLVVERRDEVAAQVAEALVDDVVVVEQPLGRGGDELVVRGRRQDRLVVAPQRGPVRLPPRGIVHGRDHGGRPGHPLREVRPGAAEPRVGSELLANDLERLGARGTATV